MRIVIFTHIVPYPLNEGGKVAQFSFLQSLVKEHQVTLIVQTVNKQQQDGLDQLQKKLSSLKIITIKNETFKVREKLPVRIAEAVNWKIKKMFSAKASNNMDVILSHPLFINPVQPRSATITSEIRKHILQEQPDILQVDFIDNADIPAMLSPSLKKILVLHDLRYASIGQAAKLQGYDEEYISYITQLIRTTELSHIKKFDNIITFSKEDALRLKNEGVENVYHSPFAIPDECFTNELKPVNSIKKLIFIGPAHHQPNIDAIDWYAKEMASVIKQKSGLSLTVIGNWPENIRKQFSNCPSINFAGFVDDLNDIVSDSIMVVPLRIGSGIRTKILEAFAKGIPVISTTSGNEGTGALHKKEVMIADTPASFVAAIAELMNNKDLVWQLQKQAHTFAKDFFSQQVVYNNRIHVYDELLKLNNKAL